MATSWLLCWAPFTAYAQMPQVEAAYSWGWLEASSQAARPAASPLPPLEGVRIKLAPQGEVASEQVFLRDIASCHGASELCEKLNAKVIAPAPAPGERMKIKQAEVAALLASELEGMELSGAGEVRVQARFLEITNEALARAFCPSLADKRFGHGKLRLSCQAVQLAQPWRVRPGDYRLRFPNWEKLEGQDEEARWLAMVKKTGRSKVEYLAAGEEQPTSEADMLIRLNLERQVLVALRSLPVGSLLKEEDFSLEWRREGSLQGEGLEDLAAYQGYVLRTPLQAEQTLRVSAISRPLHIARGESASMEIGSGDLQVTARVRAKQAGHEGDVIAVVYEPTGKEMKAQVLAKGRLKQAP